MNTEVAYTMLQEAKHRLLSALEDIVTYDVKIGGDGSLGTFKGEVQDILIQVFPKYEDY